MNVPARTGAATFATPNCGQPAQAVNSSPCVGDDGLVEYGCPGAYTWNEKKLAARVLSSALGGLSSRFGCDDGRRVLTWSRAIAACAQLLGFDATVDGALVNPHASRCRARLCPICSWRLSVSWTSRMFRAMPDILAGVRNPRFIFLTLTVPNCPAEDLRDQVRKISGAWAKLRKRREMADVVGWVRALEITRDANGDCHPHLHVLMLVSRRYFKHGYVRQAKWERAWTESMNSNVPLIVDVRACKSNAKQESDEIYSAVLKTFKYCLKGATADPLWTAKVGLQIRGLRIIAAGGRFKKALGDLDAEEDEDEDEGNYTGPVLTGDRLWFRWNEIKTKYRFAFIQEISVDSPPVVDVVPDEDDPQSDHVEEMLVDVGGQTYDIGVGSERLAGRVIDADGCEQLWLFTPKDQTNVSLLETVPDGEFRVMDIDDAREWFAQHPDAKKLAADVGESVIDACRRMAASHRSRSSSS